MKQSLSGAAWRGQPDPKFQGINSGWFQPKACEPQSHGWESVTVPSCWNSDPRYERYEGAFWYAADFDHPAADVLDLDVILRFHAVNYFCRVWVNGEEVGKHEGGYLPFDVPVPRGALREQNRLAVMVENRRSARRIPGKVFDWFNYGGIVRDVELLALSPRRFGSVRVTAEPGANGEAAVTVVYQQHEPFAFSWAVADGDRILAQGHISEPQTSGQIDIKLHNAQPWSPDNPKLYDLRLTPEPLSRAEPFSVRFGIRSIQVRGTQILLNGEPIRLQGVCLHEEQVPFGRAIPRELRYEDARAIKRLGFNALRTAHYTHDSALLDAADEIGLLVLEEIPVYWEIDYSAPETLRTAEAMVHDMIARDANHPSVILWSVGNEVPVENPACDRFIRTLMDRARSMDPTRIVTYISCRFLIGKTRASSDVACLNQYMGWYYGNERDLAELLTLARATAPDKPWLITESGADALLGFRDPGRARSSEDRQAELLANTIRTLNGLDWISGWFIWVYRDFRSPLRLNRFQKGFNRKGLVNETNWPKEICAMFPGLLDESVASGPFHGVKAKAAVGEQLERAVYTLFQPRLIAAQQRLCDKYYRGTIKLM